MEKILEKSEQQKRFHPERFHPETGVFQVWVEVVNGWMDAPERDPRKIPAADAFHPPLDVEPDLRVPPQAFVPVRWTRVDPVRQEPLCFAHDSVLMRSLLPGDNVADLWMRARMCPAEGYTVPLFRDGASMIGETAVKLKHIEAERDGLQNHLSLMTLDRDEAQRKLRTYEAIGDAMPIALEAVKVERDSLQTSLRLAAAQKAEALLQLNETAHDLDRMTEDRNKVLMSLAGVEHKLEQSEASLKLASDDYQLVRTTSGRLLKEVFDLRQKIREKDADYDVVRIARDEATKSLFEALEKADACSGQLLLARAAMLRAKDTANALAKGLAERDEQLRDTRELLRKETAEMKAERRGAMLLRHRFGARLGETFVEFVERLGLERDDLIKSNQALSEAAGKLTALEDFVKRLG